MHISSTTCRLLQCVHESINERINKQNIYMQVHTVSFVYSKFCFIKGKQLLRKFMLVNFELVELQKQNRQGGLLKNFLKNGAHMET